MKKIMFLACCCGALSLASCSKTEKKETETTIVTEETDNGMARNDAFYRERAGQVTSQMASDLKFDSDTSTQNHIEDVYYNRAKRRNEVRERYRNDTTGMYVEMKQIDLDTDKEFQSILKPEQYEVFEARRTTYYGGFEEADTPSPGYRDTSGGTGDPNAGTSGTPLSPNAKVKTKTEKDGDTKTEIEDGKTETKIKSEADGDAKVKSRTKE
jgi:hypothetical protein